MDKNLIYLLAIMIIGLVFVSPYALQFATDTLDRIGDFISEGFGDLGDTTDLFGGDGQAGMNLRVYDTKGNMYNLSMVPMSFVPMSIPINHQPDPVDLDRIEADICVTVQYDGTMTGYSMDFTLTVTVKRVSSGSVVSTWSYNNPTTVDSQGTSFPSGHTLFYTATGTKLFNAQKITATELENQVSGKGSERYAVVFDLDVDLEMTFDDGSTDTADGHATSQYQFDWSEEAGEITSLAISLDSTPI